MKKLKRYWIVIIPLAISIVISIVFAILKANSDFAEWYTNNISRYYYQAMGFLTRYIPFSLTEMFFVFLFVSGVIVIVKLIIDLVHKRWGDSLKRAGIVANMVFSTILVYALSCEMAYNRKPIDLPYYEAEVDSAEFKDIYNYYADDLNYCISQLTFDDNGNVHNNLSFKEISELVHKSVSSCIDSGYFFSTEVYAKQMVSSLIYRELGLTGVTFGPLAESNVNCLATNLEIPVTIAHEIAHTKGVMREDDANQFAFYVCLNSEHPYLRFSAYAIYFYQLSLMTSSAYISEEDIASLHKLENNYYYSRIYAANYWKEHNLLQKFGDWINSFYIESSGIPSGTGSYSGGTEVHPDPVTLKLVPSKYQKLFFNHYYLHK